MMNTTAPPTNACRQASLGDSLLLPPIGRPNNCIVSRSNNEGESKIEYIPPKISLKSAVTESSCNYGSEESGQSWYFRSDVSAITYGSDFDALLSRMNSLPQLIPVAGDPMNRCTVIHHPIKK